jgi:hypothetical protein
MAAPGTVTDPNNPYKSVAGPTWGGGNTNSILAITDPAKASIAMWKAQKKAQSTGKPALSQQELYGPVAHGSYGFAPGGGQERIGNRGGEFSPPSPTSSATGRGLWDYYNMQRPGYGQNNALQDAAQAQHEIAKVPYYSQYRQQFPWAFPQQPGQKPQQVGQAMATKAVQNAAQIGAATAFNPLLGILPHLAEGGHNQPKTYLVGEKGMEAYCPDSGGMELIGVHGPEVRTFPEKGEVIPHNKLMRFMGYPQPEHRAYGGGVEPSMVYGKSPMQMIRTDRGYPGQFGGHTYTYVPYGKPYSLQIVPRADGGPVRGMDYYTMAGMFGPHPAPPVPNPYHPPFVDDRNIHWMGRKDRFLPQAQFEYALDTSDHRIGANPMFSQEDRWGSHLPVWSWEAYATPEGRAEAAAQQAANIAAVRGVAENRNRKPTPRRYGGGVEASYYNPMMYGGYGYPQQMMGYPQMGYNQMGGYPPGFSPFAAQYLPQYMPQMQQPHYSPLEQSFADDPMAPESPWAQAKFVRMGLQQAALKRRAFEDAKAKIQENMKGQSEMAAMGFSGHGALPDLPVYELKASPEFPGVFNNYSLPNGGSARISYTKPGVTPRGVARPLDISGNPVGGIWQDPLPMSSNPDDPNAVTFSQANTILKNQGGKKKNPVSMLIGPPK